MGRGRVNLKEQTRWSFLEKKQRSRLHNKLLTPNYSKDLNAWEGDRMDIEIWFN